MRLVVLLIVTIVNAALPASSVIDTRRRAAIRLVAIKEGKRWQTVEEMFLHRGFRRADLVNPSPLRVHDAAITAKPGRRVALVGHSGTVPSDASAALPDAWNFLAVLLKRQPATVVAKNIGAAKGSLPPIPHGFPTAAVRG